MKCDTYHQKFFRKSLSISDKTLKQIAGFFKAAGHPDRLRILYHLLEGEVCVSQLSDELNVAMSTLSQQLKLLRVQNLIDFRREGKHLYYFLVDEHIRTIIEMALEHAEENSKQTN